MSFKRLVTFLILTSVLLAGVAPVLAQGGFDLLPVVEAYMPAIPQGYGGISVDTLVTELAENPPFLLDVREASELAESGFIEGAVNVPVRTLAQHLDLLPEDLSTPIVVYCAKGTRGAIGMVALQVLGYSNVRNLSGGFGAWTSGGYAVATGEPVAAAGTATGTAAAIDPELAAAVDNYLVNVLPQGWGQVSVDDVSLELAENPPFLLDVREAAELETDGYIDGSVHIALREVAANLDQIPTDQPIVVYCKSGFRGSIATVVLQMLGYDARNMSGGILAWLGADYPVVGGQPVAEEPFSLLSVIQAYMPAIPQGYGGVTVDTLVPELVENPPFLLDVREASELAESGFIEGAVNVPVRTLAQHLDLLPEDLSAPIVVYCAKGTRGAIGMVALQVLGYSNVRNLSGGFGSWTAAGNPVVTGEPVAEPGTAAAIDPELVAAVDNYLVNVLPQGWGQVSVDDVSLELAENPPFLLDVREAAELETDGYIDGSVHIALREVAANLDQIPTDQPIVVYCKSGFRGSIATAALQMLGYDARNMSGGILGWIGAGYPVVGGTTAAEEPVTVEVVLPEGTPLDASIVGPLAYDAAVTLAMQPGFGTITVEAMTGEYADAFVLDVREPNEYTEGFIPGAVNVPIRDVAKNLAILPAFDEPIVIYCASGHRAAIVEEALGILGYTNLTSLRGGIRSWTGELSHDIPVVTATAFPEVDPDLWATVDAYLSALPAGFSTISAQDLSLALTEGDTPTLIDVREASEYAGGYLEGALNLPLRSFTEELASLPAQDAPVVLYGSVGHRSALAMVAMQMAGFENVLSFPAGPAGWEGAGYALVTP